VRKRKGKKLKKRGERGVLEIVDWVFHELSTSFVSARKEKKKKKKNLKKKKKREGGGTITRRRPSPFYIETCLVERSVRTAHGTGGKKGEKRCAKKRKEERRARIKSGHCKNDHDLLRR